MCKRIIIGLFAMSVVAMWWTEAYAFCKKPGGSLFCTKGVLCGTEFTCATGQQCEVTCTADNTADIPPNNVAFCKDIATGKIRKAECHVGQTFFGSDECEQDDDGDDDKHDGKHDGKHDHDKGEECNVAIVLTNDPSSCQSSCVSGKELVADVTPVAMVATLNITSVPPPEDGFAVLRRLLLEPFGDFAQASGPVPPPECGVSPSCTKVGPCTIDPNKIEFNKVKEYQCELELLPDGGE